MRNIKEIFHTRLDTAVFIRYFSIVMKYFAPFLFVCAFALAACKSSKSSTEAEAPAIDSARICALKFNGDSAFAHVKAQCDFGPRVPNSSAIEQCGDYIEAKFKSYGLEVTNQRTNVTGWDGTNLRCRNIIAAYRPEATERVIICTHYDSRPWADADPDESKHHEPVMAANDGASGVGVMLEIARQIAQLNPKVGVDFICFDAEDYGVPDWAPQAAQNVSADTWCLGSQYWAANPHKEGYTARYGILLDMVGGRGAKFYFEGFSMKYAQSIVIRTWEAARYAEAADFFPNSDGGYITDDHVPMNETAGIPTIDIIPFYPNGESSFGPTWHTTHDTVDNIDPEVLRAVGQTLIQLLSEEE